MGTTLRTLMIVSALGTGLMAGVFFAFSSFVMAGLGRLPAATGVAAMNSINVTAVRPLFMTGLFGTAALCVAVAVWSVVRWSRPGSLLMLAGAVLYLAGAVVLTAVYNVPLNDHLAGVDPHSAGAAQEWADYLRDWTRANHVRTIASLAAAALLTVALRL